MRSTAIQKTLILSVILTLWGSVHAFAQFAGGDGSEGNPYQISDADELNEIRNYLNSHFVLVNDINLDVAPYNTGDGWEPIGDSGDPFSGTLDGNFFEITGLYIDRTSDSGLFGRANSATIKNLGILDADIKSEAGAGILLHYSSNGIHISKVYTTGKIESSGQYIGGIAGRLYESDIEQSYSRASVSGDARIGGLVGEAGSTTTITNSYATGPVLSDDTEGGLVAVGSIHTVNNSFWNTETTNQISSKGGGTGLTTTEMHDADEYTDWDFDDVWAMDAGENDGYPYLRAAYFAGGAGTEADPFEISNVYHLQNMKDHLEAHFIVINDIDASVTENWNDGEGWEPIGNGDDPFVGSLDGGGFPIKNLYINREEENPIGLFGEAGDGSILTNIGLEDAHISGRSAVGALAGNNRGDISNVYVTDVDISSVANVLGGLVGGNYGEISSSYTTGEVNSEGDDIGGLAGYLFEGAINNSYANVAVTSTGSRGVGGLVGWNHVNSTVNNSYSLGAVEGAEEFGGLIGRIRDGGVVTNSFWDTEKSGNADSDGGEGKSTAEMNAIATFTDAGWDFDDMWDFDQTKNNGYPSLQFYDYEQVLLNSIIVWNTSIGTERTGAGSLVSTLFADDPEEDTFTFTLVTGDGDDDNSDFTINGNELRTGNALVAGEYSIRISASNQQDESVEEAFTITVTEGKVAPKVAGGDSHTLLLTSDGTVYSFGNGGWGKLGHGNSDQLLVPTAIVSDELADKTIIDVAAGNIHSMLLASDGTVFTFGGSSNGQLGHNDTVARDVPTKIESPNLDGKQITAIAAGGEFNMLLASDGTVFTFGWNMRGQLGHGDEDDRTVPTKIYSDALEGKIIKAIDIGRAHSILLASDGSVFTFGSSYGGQLGHGDKIDHSDPKKIESANLDGKEIINVSAGLAHSILLASDGTVFTFGYGQDGRLGHGEDTGDKNVPTKITSTNLDGNVITKTDAGHMHSLLLTSDDKILTFGAGSQGQLGHGDNDDRFEPVELTAASLNGKTISDIDGGVIHSIILASDGTVFTFGNGTKGRLGHGDDDNRNVPTEITEFLSPPQTQASDIVISEVTNNQMNISWTNGDGANRIVFMKEGADGTAEPVNQTSYDADQTIGNGDQIDASGWFAVYNGIKNETIVTDLSAQTEYIVQIFEYNGEGGTEVYLGSAANDNPKVQKTESSFDGGNGSEADPFLISTPEQLPEIINHPDMNYELMADLDLDVPPYNTGSGWDPIGSPGTFFNGTFNGNGHSITGLYIDRPGEDMVGFFGMTSEDALIENIIIEGADVTGKDHVGVIAGINIGTIKTSFTNGTVKGNANIGGLVGSNTGDIADSYSLADVNADQAPAGGLVSMNFEGVITNSYSAGAVAGDDPEIGGLVGINEDGTVTTSFWDTESSGQDDSAGGEGKTTAEMHDVTTFENEGWDFEEDWGINSEKNGGYPFLNLQDYDHNPRGESAKLADLSVDPGEIIFDAEKIAYENVSIPNGTEHVEITFSADGEAAADQDSPQTVEVSDGKANFSVEVTSENGQQTRKYTIQFIELPEEVALLAPEQESNSVGLLPLFSWEENELAKSYELQVADNNDFSDPVILEFVTDMTEFQTEEDLNRDTDYVWRVRAINDGGEGGWSEIYSFVTMGISGQVSLVSPADSSGGIALYPELNWAAAETADSYRIQIYSSDDELVYEAEGLTGNNHTLEEKLSHHVTYQWRVQAENSGGAGEWSGWRHFVTLGEVPDVRFPAGDMENISIAPRLSWNSPYEDGQFQVQLSSDDSFTDILMDTTVNNFFVDVEGLLDESEYFWKVRFEDDLTQSLWSGAASFITRPRPEARESIEVTVDFGGTQDESGVVVSSDYRLIGAPGTDVIALDEVFQQEYNEVWKAFYDNGDESDYFVEYSEGDDNFNFSPGRGFWVLSTKVVELQREIDNVTVNHRDNFPIELNPGWNIISNPHLVDVKWSEVLELNNLDEPLYSYDASFEEAGMMIPFEGYYFYNSAELSLDTLEIPYSNLGRRGRDESPEAKEETDPGVQVQADFRDDEGNDTQVSVELMYPEVVNNETRRVSYHPSLEFSRYGVMLGYDGSDRTGIRRKSDTYNVSGEQYELELKAPVGSTVTWSAEMTEMNNAARVMLVNPVTSQSHLLSHGDRVEVMATEPEVTYNLFVGDEAYLREIQENLLPAEITLKQNYPNPFNPSTTIQYALPADEIVNLEVYDILGRRVQVLQDGFQQAGWHHVRFDGAGQASGVYIYRLVAGEQHLTGKMTLIK